MLQSVVFGTGINVDPRRGVEEVEKRSCRPLAREAPIHARFHTSRMRELLIRHERSTGKIGVEKIIVDL